MYLKGLLWGLKKKRWDCEILKKIISLSYNMGLINVNKRKEGRKEEKSANALASWAAGSVHRKHFVGAFITKQARVEFYKQSPEQQCDLETFKHSKACSLRVCRDPGLIHESERSSGEGNGNPLQYSCLKNPMEWEPGGLQSQRVRRDWSDLAHTFNIF